MVISRFRILRISKLAQSMQEAIKLLHLASPTHIIFSKAPPKFEALEEYALLWFTVLLLSIKTVTLGTQKTHDSHMNFQQFLLSQFELFWRGLGPDDVEWKQGKEENLIDGSLYQRKLDEASRHKITQK